MNKRRHRSWRDPGAERALGPGSGNYVFDRVFPAKASSREVYEEAAKDRVLTALEGVNATIFVYGPTGSGKTFTMRSILQQARTSPYQPYNDGSSHRLCANSISHQEETSCVPASVVVQHL
jgi:chromosomal replication initiation ATPase DnaA